MKLFIFRLIQLCSFSRVFWKGKNSIHLTFDDGPDPENTPIILDVLSRYEAKATFFVVGEDAEKNIDLLKQIHSAGHVVANHSHSHIRFDGDLSPFMEDVARCEQVLNQASVPTQGLFRVPYGTVSLRLLLGLLRKGYRVAFWNKDTKDYRLDQAEQVSEFMDIDKLENGDIVLLHDHTPVTTQILEWILAAHPDKEFSTL